MVTTHPLHFEALKRVRNYRKSEGSLIEILEKIEEEKVFSKLGYGSLWAYVTTGLKLCEAEASRFIGVMRKSKYIPELKVAIQSNELSISKAARVISVIKPETASSWIETAKKEPFREIEKKVAAINPKAILKEKTKCIAPDVVELKASLSSDGEMKFKRAQDLLSKSKGHSLSIGESIEGMARFYLEKCDPLLKKVNPKPVIPSGALPTWVVNSVNQRDGGQCTQLNPNGSRCTEKRFTQLHHTILRSRGGTNHPDNLVILCSNHHAQEHPWARAKRASDNGERKMV